MAGHVDTAGNYGTITFPAAFTVPPVVLLTIDESGDNNGPTQTRINGAVSATQVSYYVDSTTASRLHWIALDPGSYSYGRYRWTAGVWNNPGSCSPCTVPYGTSFVGHPGVLITTFCPDASGEVWSRLNRVTSTDFQFRFNAAANEGVHWLAFELTR